MSSRNPARALPVRVWLTILGLVLLAGIGLLVARGVAPSPEGPGAEPARAPYDAAGRPTGPVPTLLKPPNLVLLIVDTLRADSLRPDAEGMPALAAIAAGGVTFVDASANAPWTKPSVASLLTGLLPSRHGATDSRKPPFLPASVTTFAEILAQSYGYETAAYVDGGWWGGSTALLQGFRTAVEGFTLQGIGTTVGAWTRYRDPSRPFFLCLHTLEAHEPYGRENHPYPVPPHPSAAEAAPLLEGLDDPVALTRACFLSHAVREAIVYGGRENPLREVVRYTTVGFAARPDPALAAELRAAYETGVTWVDGLVGSAVRSLATWGLLKNTVLVVTGDHGEAFGEHGQLGHGRQLYDEVLRVPLVMTGPGILATPRTVSGSVGLVDVLPTYFELAGIPLPTPIDGVSLVPLLTEGSAGHAVTAEEILSEDNTSQPWEAVRASVRTSAWKYVVTYDRTSGAVVEELYDLAADPSESHDVGTDPSRGFARLDDATCDEIRRLRARILSGAEPDPTRGDGPASRCGNP